MEEPTDVSGVRRFPRMFNHLGKYLPHLAQKTKPLGELLSLKNMWTWGEAVRKFTHRQQLETKKSLKGLNILRARGEQHTNLSAALQEFSSEWLPPFTFYLIS